MAEYLHPGVYVEEKSSGVRPIEGVGTSTAAFVGATAKGVPNKATFLTTWRAFVAKFGDVSRDGPYLPYAVEQFFANGGKRCYIVRALSDASSRLAGVDFPSRETAGPARNTLRIDAKGKGGWGNSLSVRVEDGTTNPGREFRLVIYNEGNLVEFFDDLSMDPDSDRYVETAINDASDYITVTDLHAATPLANGASIHATAVTGGALAAVVPLLAGDTLTLTVPDGTVVPPLDLFALLPAPVAPQAVVDAINTAWSAFNLTAFITAAADPAGAGRLRVRHNVAGYESYFTIGGGATGAGRPLVGLAGFQQGAGTAIGATLKTASAATFNLTAPNNVLSISVHGNVLPNIVLTAGAAVPIDTVLADLNAAFAAPATAGLLRARKEGSRLVISTTNLGTADSRMLIAGTAAAVLNLTQFDGSAQPGAGVDGLGRSEPAFVQSDVGPFTLEEGANLSFTVNNGVAGADLAPLVVNFTTGATFPNLQQVSATQLRNAINAVAGGQIAASVVNGRVLVTQARRGNYYRLQVSDGLLSPNIRLRFETQAQSGFADGDAASPYFRPGFDIVAGSNEARALEDGNDGSPVSNFDLIGTADRKTGLHALDDVNDVNFVAIPGASDPAVVSAAIGYCAIRQDCFYIADATGKRDKNVPVTEPPHAQDYMRNRISPKNSYGALYYPWLQIADRAGAGRNPKRYVPPSGFIAGLYARIDNQRGVWKAPAGTETGLIGPIGLEYSVTDVEQDILNPIGVNCIRQFADSGIVVWGARTFAAQSDPEYRYVPVRRYTIYLRQSIYRGTQWSVFEPNDAPLWEQLKANIDDFMMGEFRKGALAGATPDEAFNVKCDAELNPPSEVNAGRVNMEVAFAPLKPAEFVIIRISQKSQRPQG
ncbi:MAG: phage tail sheath subtilisin-like domain-containing protein [Xanthomonadaceae bacterium]|nr:phage tail sheath subtilisin-like domain-containing protein [Xanthomonadaceae bacterium]